MSFSRPMYDLDNSLKTFMGKLGYNFSYILELTGSMSLFKMPEDLSPDTNNPTAWGTSNSNMIIYLFNIKFQEAMHNILG